jgi:hypothetical protein
VGGQLHASAVLTPGKAPCTHWIGDRVDPRAGLDNVEKRKFLRLPGLELRPLSCPARSQSLYRLRYRGCCHCCVKFAKFFLLSIFKHFFKQISCLFHAYYTFHSSLSCTDGLTIKEACFSRFQSEQCYNQEISRPKVP